MPAARERENSARDPGWLLLIHQIPPKPNYFRVKIWRHLQKLGAVGIKNSVYALPSNEEAQEDLNWVLREIVEGGGDASLVEARLRLQKRMAEIAAIDFFHARSREAVDGLLRELDERLAARAPEKEPDIKAALEKPRRATWVTRTGIHVDRMASAWLIRRFIDPEAKFKFVSAREYRHREGELRFDMFDGEFTHQGELCTFEVLLARFEITDAPLRPIAEIVHDIDLKDEKYGRADNAGFEHLINGIAMAHPEDEVRLQRASAVLDDLYEYFKRKRRGGNG